MIEISKKSWHYRWMMLWTEWYDVPSTLCGYMSRLLLGTFLTITIAISSVCGLVAAPYAWYVGLDQYDRIIEQLPIMIEVFLVLSWGVGTFAWMLILLSPLVFLITWLASLIDGWVKHQRYKREQQNLSWKMIQMERKVKRESNVNIWREWWKAKREKICPLVQFTD